MTDETRLSGTYGSDIPEDEYLSDLELGDATGYYDNSDDFYEDDEPYLWMDDNYLTGDYDFDYDDEPYLWMDEVDEEIPF